MGYQLLATRYTGLEFMFPPLNGTCDAKYHVETTKEFDRSGTMEDLNGIPASPAMSIEIRKEAKIVANIFAALDSHPHARAVRDILFFDYVEHVVARVLGPERVLWFLRECLVLGGHVYYRANTNEAKHWIDLWKGWVPKKRNSMKKKKSSMISDHDTSLSGQYVDPISPDQEEPPSLQKIGAQFWEVPPVVEE